MSFPTDNGFHGHVNKKRRIMGPPDGFNAPSKQATTSHSPTFSSTFEISGHNDLTPRPVTPANNQHDPFKNAGLKRPDASTTASCSSPSEPSGRHAFPPARPQKPVTPMSMLRPTLAREEQKVDHSHRQKVALRPPPSPVGREPGPPLKSLGSLPPVPPVPSALPQRTLRSINTTRVALSTEIAQSMFPQDSTPTIASSETNRGILRSPEKAKGKGKGRYVRNGIAERAHDLLARSRTSLILWQTEVSHLSTSTAVGRVLSNPDIKLTILSILKPPSTTDHPLVLVETRLLFAKQLDTLDLPAAGPILALLSCSSPPCTPEGLAVGRDLHVWQPYAWVSLAPEEAHGTEDLNNLPERVLLCTRFLVVRD